MSGSLITPLILIGIGILFLMRNLMPELPLLDYVANYWPLILIGWGTLRTVEIIAWSMTGRVLPRFGISGGEWILVILLIIGGLGLHTARGFYTTWLPGSGFYLAGAELLGDAYEYPAEANAPAPAAPRIVIDGVLGRVRIAGETEADGPHQVIVSGHHIVRAMNQQDADRAGESAELEIQTNGNEITVSANHARSNQRVTGDLVLSVPRGASIVSRSRETSFDINNIDGSVDLSTRNASVRLEDIGGNVRLDAANADLLRAVKLGGDLNINGSGDDVDVEDVAGRVSAKGSFSGIVQFRNLAQSAHWDGVQTDIDVQSLPGSMRLTIGSLEAQGVAGPVRISSSTKDVWLTSFTGDLDLNLSRGDVVLAPTAGSLGRMNVQLNAGDLELALPEGVAPNLVASTNRGTVNNAFGAPIQEETSERRGATLRSFGAGESMTLNVGRGNITVRRAGTFESPGRIESDDSQDFLEPGAGNQAGPGVARRLPQARLDFGPEFWRSRAPNPDADAVRRDMQEAVEDVRREIQQSTEELREALRTLENPSR